MRAREVSCSQSTGRGEVIISSDSGLPSWLSHTEEEPRREYTKHFPPLNQGRWDSNLLTSLSSTQDSSYPLFSLQVLQRGSPSGPRM
jgi:hypothetical protein